MNLEIASSETCSDLALGLLETAAVGNSCCQNFAAGNLDIVGHLKIAGNCLNKAFVRCNRSYRGL